MTVSHRATSLLRTVQPLEANADVAVFTLVAIALLTRRRSPCAQQPAQMRCRRYSAFSTIPRYVCRIRPPRHAANHGPKSHSLRPEQHRQRPRYPAATYSTPARIPLTVSLCKDAADRWRLWRDVERGLKRAAPSRGKVPEKRPRTSRLATSRNRF